RVPAYPQQRRHRGLGACAEPAHGNTHARSSGTPAGTIAPASASTATSRTTSTAEWRDACANARATGDDGAAPHLHGEHHERNDLPPNLSRRLHEQSATQHVRPVPELPEEPDDLASIR